MKRLTLLTTVVLAALLIAPGAVLALPTLQVYAPDSNATNLGPDQETWHVSNNPFTFYVVGAYQSDTLSLTGITLLLSVPQGERGTIAITPVNPAVDEQPVLLTLRGSGSSGSEHINPLSDATTDILTNYAGNDGYSTTSFLPDSFNNHYPLQDNVSDFMVYDLFSFDRSDAGSLRDYNASSGTITDAPNAAGEVKEYTMTYTGFSRVHLDAYGLVESEGRRHSVVTTWDINPGSHDTTAKVPEPPALLLLGTGLLAVAVLGRRKLFA